MLSPSPFAYYDPKKKKITEILTIKYMEQSNIAFTRNNENLNVKLDVKSYKIETLKLLHHHRYSQR